MEQCPSVQTTVAELITKMPFFYETNSKV